MYQNLALQLGSIKINVNLSGEGADHAIWDQIRKFVGLLDNLESFLGEENNPQLQAEVTRALANLAPAKGTHKLLRVQAVSLEETQKYPLKVIAAEGLGDLGRESIDGMNNQRYSKCVQSLDEDVCNGQLESYALKVFVTLSAAQETAIKAKLLTSALLLERLVALLRKTWNPDLQRNAMSVVVNLLVADAEASQKMSMSAS